MKPKTKTTASLAVVGVDIGKEVFHLVGLGTDGTIAFRRKIRRSSLKDVFERRYWLLRTHLAGLAV